jgi:anti-sigma-K factor RskA
MRHDDPRLLDALAAEYVLGTLRGPARARFERWREESPDIERLVHAWEERFAPLAISLAPIQPSPLVWPRIERRLANVAPSRPQRKSWRTSMQAIAASLALIAVLAGGFAVWRATNAPDYRPFAMIETSAGTMAWELEMDSDSGRMRVGAMPGAPRMRDRSFELWALPDTGATPVSLGVLPNAGREVHILSAAQMQAIAGASKVAVSMEPLGGSPTGVPTGPVQFVADRIRHG